MNNSSKVPLKLNLIIKISAIVLLCIGCFRIFSLLPYAIDPKADFYTYYHAGELILSGKSIYSFHNMQPPSICLIFSPLAVFSYETAAIIWVIVTIIAYLAIVVISFQVFNFNFPAHWRMFLVMIALSWYPFLIHISVGQVNILLSLLIILAWFLLKKNHDFSGGALLGFACVLKLFPGIFVLYLCIRKKWRALVAFITTVVIGLIITTTIIGIDDTSWYFLKVIPQDSPLWSAHPFNLSLRSTIDMIFQGNIYIQPLIQSKLTALIVTVIIYGACIITLFVQQFKIPRSLTGDDIAFCICIIVMLLISPITWQHIYPILVFPLFFLSSRYFLLHETTSLRYALIVFLFLSIPSHEIATGIFHLESSSVMPWYLGVALQVPMLGSILLWIALSKTACKVIPKK